MKSYAKIALAAITLAIAGCGVESDHCESGQSDNPACVHTAAPDLSGYVTQQCQSDDDCDDGHICSPANVCIPDLDQVSSCTVIGNDDGSATITCSDGTSHTVTNGENGTNGDDGLDGTNCSVEETEEGAIVTCDDGSTATITNGTDGTDGENGIGCEVVPDPDDDECVIIECETSSEVICNGDDATLGGECTWLFEHLNPDNSTLICGEEEIDITFADCGEDSDCHDFEHCAVEDGAEYGWCSLIECDSNEDCPMAGTACWTWTGFCYVDSDDDGVVDPEDECPDTYGELANGCPAPEPECGVPADCGSTSSTCDGLDLVTSGWACVSGACVGTTETETDSPFCLPAPICGNGEVEAGEECDDGNLENDDGCSAACNVEEFLPPETYIVRWCYSDTVNRYGQAAVPGAVPEFEELHDRPLDASGCATIELPTDTAFVWVSSTVGTLGAGTAVWDSGTAVPTAVYVNDVAVGFYSFFDWCADVGGGYFVDLNTTDTIGSPMDLDASTPGECTYPDGGDSVPYIPAS